METRTDGLEKTAEELRKETKNLKEELVKMKDKLELVEKTVVDNSGDRILEEISERASKERNVVLHNCVESKASSSEDIQRADLNGIQSLFSELGLRDTYAKDILLGWRQLGQKKEWVPDWSKAKVDELKEAICAIKWAELLRNKSGTESWNLFKVTLDLEVEKAVPKKLSRSGCKPLWMTRNCMRLIRKKTTFVEVVLKKWWEVSGM